MDISGHLGIAKLVAREEWRIECQGKTEVQISRTVKVIAWFLLDGKFCSGLGI